MANVPFQIIFYNDENYSLGDAVKDGAIRACVADIRTWRELQLVVESNTTVGDILANNNRVMGTAIRIIEKDDTKSYVALDDFTKAVSSVEFVENGTELSHLVGLYLDLENKIDCFKVRLIHDDNERLNEVRYMVGTRNRVKKESQKAFLEGNFNCFEISEIEIDEQNEISLCQLTFLTVE